MDGIGVLFLLFLVFGGWRLVVWALKVGGGAAVDAAQGRASFREGLNVRTKGMTELELTVEESTITDENLPIWQAKIRGLFQVQTTTRLGLVLSVVDITERGNSHPILAAMENFQEAETRAFQFKTDLGICEPGQGFPHWVDVGIVPKDLLIYPHSGMRKIAVVARLVNMDIVPNIEFGFADGNQPGIIQMLVQHFDVSVERGFLERSREDLGVAGASIRLGLSVAYADGGFDPLEGKLIKDWASKFVNEVPEGRGREEARSFINDAIRYGNEDARSKSLSISKQVEVLNQLADKPQKYSAIELCLDVMAADGSADKEELRILGNLCDSLGLDSERFNELRDHRLMDVDSGEVEGSNIWGILGINEAASTDEKSTKLRSLYSRWNSRAESLEDGTERDKCHEMLQLIAQARNLLNA